jgi:RNA polymerase sigma-54 factor
MWVGQSQVQGLYTKLNMTPQLIQAMNVLQMAAADLERYVQDQLQENPCIESMETVESAGYSRGSGSGSQGRSRSDSGARARNPGRDEELGHVCAPEETLELSLLGQLRMSGMAADLYRIARYLAGNLDENGYLRIGAEEAAACLREPVRRVEEAIAALQSLEPAGVAAATLQQCLRFQIERDSNANEHAIPIVNGYLQEVASGSYRRISGGLGIGIAEVEAAVAYIRTLNPRPGAGFSRDSGTAIVPDAEVRKVGEDYVLFLNDRSTPSLRFSPYYRQLAYHSGDMRTKAYLRDHLQAARLLIRSLEQRKVTLSRVIGAIVEEQRAFLERGVDGLKPMSLRTIAERLQLHESTVSRAVQHKFVQLPGGVYALKFFFTNGLPTSGGIPASAEAVKAKIRRLIDGENKASPLSDQQIADLLAADGLHISRRTVMKYREEQRLGSSRQRARR